MDIEPIQKGLAVIGNGNDPGGHRFGKALDVQFDIGGNARLDLMDAGNILNLLLQAFRRPLQIHKHIGKMIIPIKPVSGEREGIQWC